MQEHCLAFDQMDLYQSCLFVNGAHGLDSRSDADSSVLEQ